MGESKGWRGREGGTWDNEIGEECGGREVKKEWG